MSEATPGKQAYLSPNQRAWRRFRRNRPAVISAWFLAVLAVTILGIWLLQWSLTKSDADGAFKKSVRAFAMQLPPSLRTHPDAIPKDAPQFAEPGANNWFGTDIHGRDLFARVFAGARVSLLVGLVGTAVAFIIGVTWGAIAGYAGGRTDNWMMRFVDIMYSLPSIIFVIVLITSLGGILQDNLNPRVRLTDFGDPKTLFHQLAKGSDAGTKAVAARLSEDVQKQLSAMPAEDVPSDDLQKAVATELNRLVEGNTAVFTNAASIGVALRDKTSELAAQKPKGSDLMRLNRLMLEDALPGQLKHRETWVSLSLAVIFPPDSSAVIQIMFLFIGLGAVSWLTMARIVRGQVLSLRNRQFVDASRSLGATPVRLLVRHILPNVYGIIIVYLTLTLPAIMLYESFLSYLGLGVQPPMASWGSLIAEGAQQLNSIRIYWWLLVFPSGALISTLLALNFVGDGLRDAFEPKGGE